MSKAEVLVRVAKNTDRAAATTESFKTKMLESWFACNDVQLVRSNFNILRRSRDQRETDAQKRVYHDFTLLQYACVFDNLEIMKVMYDAEKDFVTSVETQLRKNNTDIMLPAKCTPLMIAIACNSTRCTMSLLQKINMNDVRIDLNEANESASLMAARLPGVRAAELALECSNLQTKEFYYEND